MVHLISKLRKAAEVRFGSKPVHQNEARERPILPQADAQRGVAAMAANRQFR
jgi:hypothetical protein